MCELYEYILEHFWLFGPLNDPTSTIFIHSYPFTQMKIHLKHENNAMMGIFKLTS